MSRQLDGVSVILNTSEKRKVVDWFQGMMLHGTSPSALHNAAKGLYEDKTGDWVFETPEWDSRINCRERAIWIHGIPGAGKTVLVSHVIERTLDICEAKGKQTTCIYYYCYHGHNKDESTPFLRWLVSRLLQRLDEVPEAAWKAYERHTEPDFQLLLGILGEFLRGFDRVYVGIDALDESLSQPHLLALLETLIIDIRFSKMQLLATSDEYEVIRRKMSSISQPLSMSNSFVEADIRLYVAAKIGENPKFQRWPGDLRDEVENNLSTGARGMFRWAVCQLDILRRLHHQSKIREAIKSLPETLDETYARIFSYVAVEDRELVRHALHWVCFHNFLWKGIAPLPAQVLLDSYTFLDQVENRPNPDDFLYDLETLKDVCGCLVSFSRKEPSEKDEEGTYRATANIAHYTVREFLESSRASTSLTAWMKMSQKDCYVVILSSIFTYALTSKSPPLDCQDYDFGGNGPLGICSTSNLRGYCLASSVRSLTASEELVQPSLTFQLLDPRAAHYEDFHYALAHHAKNFDENFLTYEFFQTPFWRISWADHSRSSDAAILISLLAMDCLALAKVFVQDLDVEGLMQEILTGQVLSPAPWINSGELDNGDEFIQFDGNLVDVLGQIRELRRSTLDFLQQEASTLIDYANLLPNYMPAHDFYTNAGDLSHVDDCALPQLLYLGAHADPKGFQVMPLQIAVYTRDIVGVRALLEAGADPNNAGDPQGIAWDNDLSLLYPYSKLHGVASIDILGRFRPRLNHEHGMENSEIEAVNGAVTDEIERLLLAHGATPAKRPRRQWGSGEKGIAAEETESEDDNVDGIMDGDKTHS